MWLRIVIASYTGVATTLVVPSGAVDVLGDNVTRRPLSLVSWTSVKRQVRIVTMHAVEVTEAGGTEVLNYVEGAVNDGPAPSWLV